MLCRHTLQARKVTEQSSVPLGLGEASVGETRYLYIFTLTILLASTPLSFFKLRTIPQSVQLQIEYSAR